MIEKLIFDNVILNLFFFIFLIISSLKFLFKIFIEINFQILVAKVFLNDFLV